MARALAPAGARSGPETWGLSVSDRPQGPAAQASGSKLPRHNGLRAVQSDFHNESKFPSWSPPSPVSLESSG
nr:hypothetical protein C1892_24870 [Pseudomonas sp. MPBD7-1]